VCYFVTSKKFGFPASGNFIRMSKKVEKSRFEIKIDLKMKQKYATILTKTQTSKNPLLESKMKGAAV